MSSQVDKLNKPFVVHKWDDFHDDGSEDGLVLGEFATFEEAESFLFAAARAHLHKAVYSGDPMISWSINGNIYRIMDHAAMNGPFTEADRELLKRYRK